MEIINAEDSPHFLSCCFTSTETIKLNRDGGAQDGHLDFHTAPELCIVPT